VALVLLGNGAVIIAVERSELRRSLLREGRTFARLAAPQALRAYGESEWYPGGEGHLLEKLRAIGQGLPALKAFAIFSERGRLLVAYPSRESLPEVDFKGIELWGSEGSERRNEVSGVGEVELIIPTEGGEGIPPTIVQLVISEEELGARLFAIVQIYVGSLLILLALGAYLAFRVADSILKPIASLKATAERLGGGELWARVEEYGSGEIHELAHTFNLMARDVEHHRDQLEERNIALERAYGDLQSLQQELLSLERVAAVGRTAAAVSHEIDNPIGIILGTAQMVKEEVAGDEELFQDLSLIEEECKRVRRIVRDLLNLARPSSEAPEEVELKEVAELVLRGVSHHPQFRNIEIYLDWNEDFPRMAVDPDGIKQVFLNLLINAARVMEGQGKITIRAFFDSGVATIEVIDSGPGVPEEALERVFEPLFTTSPKGESAAGAGLGLSVSRRIIEEAGGKLFAEHRSCGGVFIIQFPEL